MDDDAPRRTMPIKPGVLSERCGDLRQTKEQSRNRANRTIEWAWRYDEYRITSKK